jgi:hypothetical protein
VSASGVSVSPNTAVLRPRENWPGDGRLTTGPAHLLAQALPGRAQVEVHDTSGYIDISII